VGQWAERQKAFLRERATLEMDAIGVDMVDGPEGVRAACNIPVEYTGEGVIRSERGDNPRREFGNLWASFGHRVTESLTIFSDMTVAHYARRLHNDLNRPFFTHLKARWDREVGPRILQAIYGKR
jgi:hypothetical protein